MAEVSLRQLPFAVKLAVGLTFFNSWVLFAEVVVDRHGLWRYMPGYKVGTLCPWDVAVAALIVAGVVYAVRRGKRHGGAQAEAARDRLSQNSSRSSRRRDATS
jgi:cytochrome c-type biogenesis protein CcmH/NrfF